MTDKPIVLFVCVHNAGRSQMAAGWLKSMAGDRIEIRSAGSEPADRINPLAVQAMNEVGIDIAGEQPKVLTIDAVRRPTLWSRWAAATPAHTSPANATKTGSSPTQPINRSKWSARFATPSNAEWRRSSGHWRPSVAREATGASSVPPCPA